MVALFQCQRSFYAQLKLAARMATEASTEPAKCASSGCVWGWWQRQERRASSVSLEMRAAANREIKIKYKYKLHERKEAAPLMQRQPAEG